MNGVLKVAIFYLDEQISTGFWTKLFYYWKRICFYFVFCD